MSRARVEFSQDELVAICRRRAVKRLALFGSVLRDDFRADSDVDVLVEFGRPAGLFDFVRVRRRLEDALGRRVDLVTPEALRPAMREAVLRDAVRAA
jgi:hypothetical protein